MRNPIKNMHIHLLGITIVGLLVAGGYLVGVRPALSTQSELERTVAETALLTDRIDQIAVENTQLQQQIDEKTAQILQCYDLPSPTGQPLLETVSQLLETHQLELVNLKEDDDESSKQQFIQVQVRGAYEAIARFLFDLRRLDRPARISNLNVVALDSSGQMCSAQMGIEFAPRSQLTELLSDSGRAL